MRKIISLALSLFIISLTFLGCFKQNLQLELLDKVSGFDVLQTETCILDGKQTLISEGKIYVSTGQHIVEVNGYYDATVSIEKGATEVTKVSLTPKAYLVIFTNATQETITIDDVEPQYSSGDSAFVTSLEKAEGIKTHEISISPVIEGARLIKISSAYFEDFSLKINIKEGKNSYEAILKPDENKIKNLVSSIIFPEDMKDFNFNITFQGMLNGQEMGSKNINGKFSGGIISQISDENLTYTFKNGNPYIGDQKVKDSEELQALLFASDTLKEFLDIKVSITNFALLSGNENATVYVDETNGNGFIILEGYKLFEERNVYEHFVVNFSDKSVNSISLLINSDELKTNLNADIQITGR